MSDPLFPNPDSQTRPTRRWVTALRCGQPLATDSDVAALATLFCALPVPVAIARVADGTLIYANPYFKTVFGFAADTDETGIALAPCFEPAAWQVLLQALLQYRFLLNYELRLSRSDRSHFWGLVSLQLLQLDSEPIILGIFHDITYPKQIEQTLHDSQRTLATLTNHLPGALYRCRLDARQSCEFVSAGCEPLSGYTRADFLSGARSWRELIAPDDRQHVQQILQTAIATYQSYTLEYRLITAGQDVRWVWEQGGVLTAADGTPTGLQGFITDITDRKRAEAALQESERRLSSLLDATPGIFFRASNDAAWSMTYISEGCQTLTGYSSDTFTRERGAYDRLTHPDDRARALAAINENVAHHRPYVVEYRIRTRDGHERWVWEKGHGVYSAAGTIAGIEGFISDITDRKQSEEAARAYAGELQALFAAMTDLILVLDADGRYLKIAPTNPDLLYQPKEVLLGKRVTEVLPAAAAAHVLATIQQALESGQPIETEYSLAIHGRHVWFAATVSPTAEGTVVWVARDVTGAKESQAALEAAEAKYRSIFEHAVEGIFQTTTDGRYLSANPALARIYGYDSPEALIASLTDIEHQLYVDPDQRAEFVRRVQADGLVRGFEAQIYRRDGDRIWISESARAVRDRHGQLLYYEGMVEDITAQKQAEAQLHWQAFYDPLTGLPNRALFRVRLGEALERLQANQAEAAPQFAVLFLDLDRFKIVNDSLGHLIGDQLLVAIARRLERCLREGDMVARLGGDEFTVLLHDVRDIHDATHVADRISAALQVPFNLDGYQVFTGASIGIVLSRDRQAIANLAAEAHSREAAQAGAAVPLADASYQKPEDLLRDADTALYRAKALGKGRYELFDADMHRTAVAQLQLETEMRQAIESQEFVLYYQPIVALDTNTLNGFEVLLRWQHPRRGLLYPADFMALAEETGLLVPLGYWLLSQACQQLCQWQAAHASAAPLVLEINCSTRQFLDPELIARLDAVCQHTGIRGPNLRLAIAESLWSDKPERVQRQLAQLHARQIQLGVDDFGAGYSRLRYLNEVPIDTLKIDRSFIRDIASDPHQAEIAHIAILLAHKQGLAAIAEGVETEAQLATVRTLGCDFAQGYWFADALTASDASVWLNSPAVD